MWSHNLTRKLIVAASLALSPVSSRAAVVAQYQADFTTSGPAAPGWSYLWNKNASASMPVGDPSTYVPLVRDTVTGIWETQANTWPAPPPAANLAITPTSVYPGQGKSQSGSTFDRYAIVAYTFSAADVAKYGTNASLPFYHFTVPNTVVDPIQAFMYLNSTYVISAVLSKGLNYSDTSSGSYPVVFGNVAPGDTAYIAIGPRVTDTGDRLDLDFSITLSSTFQVFGGNTYTDPYTQVANGPGIDVAAHDSIVYDVSGLPASYDQYRQWLLAGQGGQNGIYTTAPLVPGSNHPAVIAPVSNHLLHLSEFAGVALPSDSYDQMFLKYTYAGDVNLDGQVTEDDYLNVVAHMGQQATYFEGDADLDGVVTLNDLAIVRDNMGAGVNGDGPPLTPMFVTVVPEPGMIGGLAAIGLLLCRNTRRRLRL